MNKESLHKNIRLLICTVIFFFGHTLWCSATPVSFTGTVTHSHKEDGEDITSIDQNTTLNLDQQLTTVMQLTENIRYNSSWEGSTNTESIAPTLSLLINNDIFDFDLTGTATNRRTTDGPNRNNHSWESRINSTWDKILWPELQFIYGQSYAEDDQKPQVIDFESSHTGFDVDWNILVADIFYSYDDQTSENLVTQSEGSNTSQVARFDTQKSFLDRAIDTTFSYQFSTTTRDFSAKVNTSGFVLEPIVINESRGANDYDDPPQDVDWNADLVSPLPEVLRDEIYHLAIETLADAPNVLYLYTDEDLTDEAHLFQWQVYTSADGISWTRVTPDATHTYETLRQRFEVTLPTVTQRYTMLVEQLVPTTVDFSIINIEGYKKVVGNIGDTITNSTKTDTHQTNASVSWQLNPDLTFSSIFSFEEGKGDDFDYDEINTNSSLAWTPTEFISTSANIGETRDDRSDEAESIKRSYGLSLSTQILPTLDINSAVTRSDDYEDGNKISTRYNYSILTSAILFPDLNATLDLGYLTNKDEESGDTNKDFNSNLILTARLFPDLTATLEEKYTESRSTDVSRTTGSRIILSWRPSDILSVNTNWSKEWENGEGQPDRYNITIGMAPTSKVQLNMAYSHSETNDSYSLSTNWHINDIFTVFAGANYKDPSTGDAFIYQTMLTVRY